MKKLSLLITATLGLALGVNAQDTLKYEAHIVAPAFGDTLSCTDSLQFQYEFINLGTNPATSSWIAGDTLLLVSPNSAKQEGWIIALSNTFAPGDTLRINQKMHQSEINRWINVTTEQTNYVQDGQKVENGEIGLMAYLSVGTNSNYYADQDNSKRYYSKFYYNCDLSTAELAQTSLNVYPNPANSSINFTHNFNKATEATVKVLDLMGRTVLVEQYDVNAGSKNFNIDVTGLANGSYFVELTTAEERGVTKFTVAK